MYTLITMEATHSQPVATRAYNLIEDCSSFLCNGCHKPTFGDSTDAMLAALPRDQCNAHHAVFHNVFQAGFQKLSKHWDEHPVKDIFKQACIFDPRLIGTLSDKVNDFGAVVWRMLWWTTFKVYRQAAQLRKTFQDKLKMVILICQHIAGAWKFVIGDEQTPTNVFKWLQTVWDKLVVRPSLFVMLLSLSILLTFFSSLAWIWRYQMLNTYTEISSQRHQWDKPSLVALITSLLQICWRFVASFFKYIYIYISQASHKYIEWPV